MSKNKSSEWKTQAREIWRLSVPAILTQITTVAMEYIDSAMVGALGANASAAIGLVASSTWLVGGLLGGVARSGAGHKTEGRERLRGARAFALQRLCGGEQRDRQRERADEGQQFLFHVHTSDAYGSAAIMAHFLSKGNSFPPRADIGGGRVA